MANDRGDCVFDDEEGFDISSIEELTNDEDDTTEMDERELSYNGRKLWRIAPRLSKPVDVSKELGQLNDYFEDIEHTRYGELVSDTLEMFENFLSHEDDSTFILADQAFDDLRSKWDDIRSASRREEKKNPELSETLCDFVGTMEKIVEKLTGFDTEVNE